MTRPGMSDARAFTNYLPNCQLNNMISNNQGFHNNIQYKEYIQKNAEAVMNQFSQQGPRGKVDCNMPSNTVKM